MVHVSVGDFLLLILLSRSQRDYQLWDGKVSPVAEPVRIFPVDIIMRLLIFWYSGLECQETMRGQDDKCKSISLEVSTWAVVTL